MNVVFKRHKDADAMYVGVESAFHLESNLYDVGFYDDNGALVKAIGCPVLLDANNYNYYHDNDEMVLIAECKRTGELIIYGESNNES